MRNDLTDSQKRLHKKIASELGCEVIDALNDKNVIEIMLNDDGSLWIEKLGNSPQKLKNHSCSAQSAIHTIASMLNTSVTFDNPILECELPLDGSRFEALVPPVAERPIFTIRKKPIKVFTLEEYESEGILNKVAYKNDFSLNYMPDSLTKKEVIEYAVKHKKNILIVGSTGSGKTTLTNAIIDEIVNVHPEDRLIIIEDTNEIQCNAQNKVTLRAKRGNPNKDLLRLLMATMRLRPDRILIGEVRDKTALELLKAWNTGHPGGCVTIHADSALLGLKRMEQLISEATPTPMPELIGEVIDIVIFITKTKSSRIVAEILEVRGYDSLQKKYITKSFK